MDTLTHALSGVLLARVTRRVGAAPGAIPEGRRSLACALAAAFPDLDYSLILWAPQAFLNLHRGPTHSLVLLPLWALLLALAMARLPGWGGRSGRNDLRHDWRPYWPLCALGLLAHIAGDWVTLYGTQLFYPLSRHPHALGISYDFNPWIAVVMAAGVLAGSGPWGRAGARRAAGIALLLAAVLLAGQAGLRQQALAVARQAAPGQPVLALPQPLSPFHWGLVAREGAREGTREGTREMAREVAPRGSGRAAGGETGREVAWAVGWEMGWEMDLGVGREAGREAAGWRIAYLDLLGGAAPPSAGSGWLGRLAGGYRPRTSLHWRTWPAPDQTPEARAAWVRPELAGFRRFARLPALYRMDPDCVWFTDLRHALPGLPPPFRYGACRAAQGEGWRVERLPYRLGGER